MLNKLQKGDTVGVIAPSSPITKDDLETINNSIMLMEASGFKVKFAKNAFSNTLGYGATPKEKAEDIHEMFKDQEVKVIFCVSGGFNSNTIFDYLDFKLIKNNPKPICGFSDSTSLLNIINEKTGIPTFHGATFKALTSWATEYAYKEVIKRFVEGKLEIGEPEDEWFTIQEGIAKGQLVGGNLSLINELLCGKYSINFENKILFLEEFSLESPPELVSNYLYNMKQNGVFDKINGMWIGNYDGSVPLEKIVLDVLDGEYKFPIVKSNNFGHTEKKTVIPIGIMAKIDSTKHVKIELLEQCVK